MCGRNVASRLRGFIEAAPCTAVLSVRQVLTTYDVLKRDVARQPDPGQDQRSLRRGKRCGACLAMCPAFWAGMSLFTA